MLSIKDNVGGALTAGVMGSIAVLCLMTGNAVHLGTNAGGAQDALAAELDARVAELVAAGADESAARSVVKKAVRFGRGQLSNASGSDASDPAGANPVGSNPYASDLAASDASDINPADSNTRTPSAEKSE